MFWGHIWVHCPQPIQAVGFLSSGMNSIRMADFGGAATLPDLNRDPKASEPYGQVGQDSFQILSFRT